MEFAGEVEAVGSAVTEFEVGDPVFGVKGFGAHAELVCVPETAALAHKPAGIGFEEAAAVCDGACIAWRACERRIPRGTAHPRLRRLRIDRHRGGAAGQALRGRGDGRLSPRRTSSSCARSGADEVVDYLQEDFSENGGTYDVVFDAVGKHSFRRCRGSLKPGGRTSRPTSASSGTCRSSPC